MFKLPDTVDAGLACISTLNAGDVWVGGRNGPVAAHWNGSAWRVFRRNEMGFPPHSRAGNSIDAISASAAGDVWAVSYNGYYVLRRTARWRGPSRSFCIGTASIGAAARRLRIGSPDGHHDGEARVIPAPARAGAAV